MQLFCHRSSGLALRAEPHTVCMPSYLLPLGWSRSTMSGSHSMGGGADSSYSASKISERFERYSKPQCGCAILSRELNPTDQGDWRCEQQTPVPVWGLSVGSGTLQCSRRGTPQLHHPKFQQSNWPSLPLTSLLQL